MEDVPYSQSCTYDILGAFFFMKANLIGLILCVKHCIADGQGSIRMLLTLTAQEGGIIHPSFLLHSFLIEILLSWSRSGVDLNSLQHGKSIPKQDKPHSAVSASQRNRHGIIYKLATAPFKLLLLYFTVLVFLWKLVVILFRIIDITFFRKESFKGTLKVPKEGGCSFLVVLILNLQSD